MAVVAVTRITARCRRIATGLVRATEATAERHRLTRHHTGCTAWARNLMAETSETRERSRTDSALHRVQVPCALGRQWARCAAQFDMKGRLDLRPIPTRGVASDRLVAGRQSGASKSEIMMPTPRLLRGVRWQREGEGGVVLRQVDHPDIVFRRPGQTCEPWSRRLGHRHDSRRRWDVHSL